MVVIAASNAHPSQPGSRFVLLMYFFKLGYAAKNRLMMSCAYCSVWPMVPATRVAPAP